MVPLRWPRAEQTQQCSLLDFAGQCWLWQLSNLITFAAAALGLPTKLELGWSWLLLSNSSPEEV